MFVISLMSSLIQQTFQMSIGIKYLHIFLIAIKVDTLQIQIFSAINI